MSRPWPLITALAAFALYLATMSHVHHGDTPLYVEQILAGEYLARPHMLPRPLGALAIAIGALIAPGAGPYPPLIVLDAAAGALCVGLLHALIRRLLAVGEAGGLEAEILAAVCAVGFAVTRVTWGIATTFELALFPLVFLLLAFQTAAESPRSTRPLLAAVGIGSLQAVAFGFHAIAIAALPALVVALATEPREQRDRAYAIGALVASTAVFVVLLYQALSMVFAPVGAPTPNALLMLAQFAEPTLDAQQGKIQPASMAFRGFGEALCAAPWSRYLSLAWLAALVVGSLATGRAAWARYGGMALVPPVWLAGVSFMAIRVESGNYEYYAQAMAACFVWSALIAGSTSRPRVGAALLGVFVAVVGWNNLWLALENHESEDGAHVEVRFRAGNPERPALRPPREGGPVHPPPGAEPGPVNPPPKMRPGGR